MTRILLAALALAAAAPATANEQLARSLGVEPGRYTIAQLAVIKTRSTFESNDGVVYIDHTRFAPSRAIHGEIANQQFDRAIEQSRGESD